MSRTVKDRKELPTLPSIYEIVRRPDGTFDISHNGELTDTSIPDQWREDQLLKYGICRERVSGRTPCSEYIRENETDLLIWIDVRLNITCD